MAAELREAAEAFCRDGGTCPIERLGEGNINETFLVRSEAADFVLQKINAEVFSEPHRVIDNFVKITEHLLKKQRELGLGFSTASPVRALGGELCYRDSGGGFWRGQTYLAAAHPENLSGESRIRRAGRTLARFHLLAANLDVAQLAEPLPGFHHLPGYMAELDGILGENPRELDETGRTCLKIIDLVRPRATHLEEAKEAGILTVQPIHGDPKIDNFIFSDTGDGMLDFDTVGGGLIHYDLGDCLRSCCNRAGEKGGDPSSVSFDLPCCRLLLEGYFAGGSPLAGETQRDLIFEAAYLIAFELGVRFFTDHLRGNTYFRVARDGENLERAVRQFRLVEDIAAKERDIRRIIKAAATG